MYEQPANQPPPYQPPPFQPSLFQPPPPPKKRTGLIVGLISGGVVLLLCVCIGVFAAARFSGIFNRVTSDPANAKVGDCITETVKADASDAKVVACNKPEAKNKVVGVVSNVSESEFDSKNQELCDAYPDWENVIWLGRSGGTGKVLCLAPNG
jgi:hypothetical protein